MEFYAKLRTRYNNVMVAYKSQGNPTDTSNSRFEGRLEQIVEVMIMCREGNKDLPKPPTLPKFETIRPIKKKPIIVT